MLIASPDALPPINWWNRSGSVRTTEDPSAAKLDEAIELSAISDVTPLIVR